MTTTEHDQSDPIPAHLLRPERFDARGDYHSPGIDGMNRPVPDGFCYQCGYRRLITKCDQPLPGQETPRACGMPQPWTPSRALTQMLVMIGEEFPGMDPLTLHALIHNCRGYLLTEVPA